MKQFKIFINEEKKEKLFKVTYNGKYTKTILAIDKEDAIKKFSKNKSMKFDPKKYSVEIVNKLKKSIGMA